MKNFTRILFVFLSFLMLGTVSIQAQHCVDATIYRPSTMKYYIFRGNEYARYDAFTNAFDAGYPKLISSGSDFTFVDPDFNTGLSAAVHLTVPQGEFELFFKGSKMAIYNVATNTFTATVTIGNNFSDLPADWKADGIDAAFSAGSFLYLVKGFDFRRYAISSGFNNPTLNLTGLLTDAPLSFPSSGNNVFTGMDAAYLDFSNEVAFLRGKAVYKNNFVGGGTSTTNLDAEFVPWPWNPCNQPFENGTDKLNVQIPDDNVCDENNEFPVIVNGTNTTLPGNTLGTDVALDKVSVYITHSWTDDLVMSVISPSGKEVSLCSSNGQNGNGFGTSSMDPLTFSMFAADSIKNLPSGNIVHTGSFVPLGDFMDFNDGSSVLGNWKLKICDDLPLDPGTLWYAELSFSGRPVANCNTGVSVQLDEDGVGSISVAEIDNASTSWDGSAPTNLVLDNTTLNCSAGLTVPVTLTVTGNNGLTNTCTPNVMLDDDTDPEPVCNQNVEVTLDGAGMAAIEPADIDAGSMDECGIASLTVNPTTISSPGNFTVQLTATDNAGNTASCTGSVIALVNSVDDIKSLTKFDIFPNPTNGMIRVDLEFNQRENADLTITDLFGKQIRTIPLEGQSFQLPVDLGDLPNGVYHVTIQTEQGLQTQKVVVSN